MKLVPFELKKWEQGWKLYTRDGREIRGLRDDREHAEGAYVLSGFIYGKMERWTIEGKYISGMTMPSVSDLMLAERGNGDIAMTIDEQLAESERARKIAVRALEYEKSYYSYDFVEVPDHTTISDAVHKAMRKAEVAMIAAGEIAPKGKV